MIKKISMILLFLATFVGAAALVPLFLVKKVEIITPRTGKVVDAIYATGTVEPSIMVPIAPRSAAHLTEIAASEGQEVKKGDILARLEDTEIQASIAELEAKLAFSSSDYKRKQQLFKSGSTSRDILEQAKADFDSLTAQLDKAKAQAGYLTLIAPADGLIIRRDGEVGELISAGQAVFYMSCCAPLRITAEVDEEDIPNVTKGQDVLIQSDAFPDKVYHGQVSTITPKGDSVARSYRVRISFDENAAPLMIGMTAETNIILKQMDNALLIPLAALGKNNRVQVVQGRTIKHVKVETGIKDINAIQILSGLTKDDSVVVPFRPDYEDGQRVRSVPFTESAD